MAPSRRNGKKTSTSGSVSIKKWSLPALLPTKQRPTLPSRVTPPPVLIIKSTVPKPLNITSLKQEFRASLLAHTAERLGHPIVNKHFNTLTKHMFKGAYQYSDFFREIQATGIKKWNREQVEEGVKVLGTKELQFVPYKTNTNSSNESDDNGSSKIIGSARRNINNNNSFDESITQNNVNQTTIIPTNIHILNSLTIFKYFNKIDVTTNVADISDITLHAANNINNNQTNALYEPTAISKDSDNLITADLFFDIAIQPDDIKNLLLLDSPGNSASSCFMDEVDSHFSACPSVYITLLTSPITNKRAREGDEGESAGIDALPQHQDKRIKQEDITSYDEESDDYSDVIAEIGVTSIAMALEYRAMKNRYLSLDSEMEMERQVEVQAKGNSEERDEEEVKWSSHG